MEIFAAIFFGLLLVFMATLIIGFVVMMCKMLKDF